jgi:hypothetical protein
MVKEIPASANSMPQKQEAGSKTAFKNFYESLRFISFE